MRGFATTTMLVLAVAGLSACNRNKAANNSTTANTVAAPAASAPTPDQAMDPAIFRAAMAEQCAQTVRAQPAVPAEMDVAGICSCATEATLGGRSDPFAFTQTPEGQQVFNQALNQCLQQSLGAGAASPAAEGAEDGADAPE